MRTISFVDRLELEFGSGSGQHHHPLSLCQQAIALGDYDNDGVSTKLILQHSIDSESLYTMSYFTE